jgi:hypothetical protein
MWNPVGQLRIFPAAPATHLLQAEEQTAKEERAAGREENAPGTTGKALLLYDTGIFLGKGMGCANKYVFVK